jgi:hypothetical protein
MARAQPRQHGYFPKTIKMWLAGRSKGAPRVFMLNFYTRLFGIHFPV